MASLSRIAQILVLAAMLAGCNSRVYVSDGVTDGDRFSLPDYVNSDGDPVTQSWVAYSVGRSFCQLEMGGDNPARNHSFDCELLAREALVDRWADYGDVNNGPRDPAATYIDQLADAADASYLDEYVWRYLRRRGWQKPIDLNLAEFEDWRANQDSWKRHRPVTKIIGSWGYVPEL